MNPRQIRELIVRPALQALDRWDEAAEMLVLRTGYHESAAFTRLQQYGHGPAIGWWQMEPATHDDCWANFLRYQPQLSLAICQLTGINRPQTACLYNPCYAACMCRVKYLRVKAPLPSAADVEGQAQYWKRYYNSVQGAGDPLVWAAHAEELDRQLAG